MSISAYMFIFAVLLLAKGISTMINTQDKHDALPDLKTIMQVRFNVLSGIFFLVGSVIFYSHTGFGS